MWSMGCAMTCTTVLLCARYGSHAILRWPLLVLFGSCAFAAASGLALLHLGGLLWEHCIQLLWPRRLRVAQLAELGACTTYRSWQRCAQSIDDVQSTAAAFLQTAAHPQYNNHEVRGAVQRLRAARKAAECGDECAARELVRLLGIVVRHNFAGVDNEELYAQTHLGTKPLIETFVDEVCLSVEAVGEAAARTPSLHPALAAFTERCSLSFGRTALCLSGGGMLANYHFGVVIALRDAHCLPTCIAGSSAGAAVAAVVCTRTERELDDEGVLEPKSLVALLAIFNDPHMVSWRRGHLASPVDWLERVRRVCNHAKLPDITFEEAFQRSGRELSVTVSARRRHEPPLLLNRIVAPDVTVASAVLASVAMPFLLPAQELTYKDEAGALRPWSMSDCGRSRWRDGSIAGDTPRMKLGQQFRVAYCLVSQVNPHFNPIVAGARPQAGRPRLSRLHGGRDDWRGGFILSAWLTWLLLETTKWLHCIHQMQLLPQIMDTDWSRLMIQNFVGEATIAPPLTLRDLAKALSNPTVPELDRYIRIGKQETWRKMGLISTRFRIAQALEALASRLTERAAGVQTSSPALDITRGEVRRSMLKEQTHAASPRPFRSPARERAVRTPSGPALSSIDNQWLESASQPAAAEVRHSIAAARDDSQVSCKAIRFF